MLKAEIMLTPNSFHDSGYLLEVFLFGKGMQASAPSLYIGI